jgi:methyltransferase-like protein/2-polyprenyl-3-methyl-5-hydroxy-6-metoxy-1,4-benzoquinol methylase
MNEQATPTGENDLPGTSYDAVPYSVSAFAQTRPDHLATIATLFGMRPAPADGCRVLELGCALGGNLIPMALASPGSRYVGIDLSLRQIDEGRKMVRELGLGNIQLEVKSILDVDDSFGQFDYILTHGVYSWVPPQVQEKILEISRRNLAPQGVAYVSYNALPGWHARAAVREMLWYHTAALADPAERVKAARGLLAFLAKAMPEQLPGYGALVRQELDVLTRTPDSYLLHEHLEEYNEPLYFHQFADRAARAGLQYLGEAQVATMFAGRFGAATERVLRQISADLLHMEQYMDFLRNRMFRQTLLCHADVKLDYALRPESVMGLRVASQAKAVLGPDDLRSAEAAQFRVGGVGPTLTTREPLMKAAMLRLAAAWPLPIFFPELLAAAREDSGTPAGTDAGATELAARLLNCFGSGLVELSISPPPYVLRAGDRPVASPYARLRAAQAPRVVNMRLESVDLADRPREILRLLDGRHDRAALLAVIRSWGPDAIAGTRTPEDALDQILTEFGRIALLVASE